MTFFTGNLNNNKENIDIHFFLFRVGGGGGGGARESFFYKDPNLK